MEASIFASEHYEELAKRAEREARAYENHFSALSLPASVLVTEADESKHQEALNRARQMRAKRDEETTTLGRSFIRDANEANAFSKLSRYETTIERSLYKALHERTPTPPSRPRR